MIQAHPERYFQTDIITRARLFNSHCQDISTVITITIIIIIIIIIILYSNK